MYEVKIEQFEGPLDLLLEIIEAKKLPLVEISLAQITDQFVGYLKNVQQRDTEEIVQFLSVASRLILLKSRELVPSLDDEDEEGSIATLQKQLAFYQPFRRAGRLLARRSRSGKRLHARESYAGFDSIFFFPKKLKTKTLASTLEDLLSSITLPARIPQARLKSSVSLEQCINELLRICKRSSELNFSEFIRKKKTEERLIHFVGALELVRSGKVNATQKNNFGTIVLARNK